MPPSPSIPAFSVGTSPRSWRPTSMLAIWPLHEQARARVLLRTGSARSESTTSRPPCGAWSSSGASASARRCTRRTVLCSRSFAILRALSLRCVRAPRGRGLRRSRGTCCTRGIEIACGRSMQSSSGGRTHARSRPRAYQEDCKCPHGTTLVERRRFGQHGAHARGTRSLALLFSSRRSRSIGRRGARQRRHRGQPSGSS